MIGDPYATLSELKTYLGPSFQGHTEWDAFLTSTLIDVSSKVEGYCGRQFNTNGAGSESQRIFEPSPDPRIVEVDDFVLTNNFVLGTDPSGSGDFAVTWTAPLDYELEPFNGVVNGQPGWPYYRIRAIAGVWFPLIAFRRQGTVRINAQWGWPSVPGPVHQATLILAASYFHLKEAPFGVAGITGAGFSGIAAVKVRDNPMACSLLHPYVVPRMAVQIG